MHKRERNVQKRCDGTCKIVVLLFKPIVLLTFSLPSASLDLKTLIFSLPRLPSSLPKLPNNSTGCTLTYCN